MYSAQRWENTMQANKVLIINDFETFGGAEQVYKDSAEALYESPDVMVEKFDNTKLDAANGVTTRLWNASASRKLDETIRRFRPTRVWVHNYHNHLSPSILGVIARHKATLGYKTYLTCHDYNLVFYNSTMLYYRSGLANPVPLRDLGTLRSFLACTSAKGRLHDALKKAHWHAVDKLVNPKAVFDLFLCPSPFIQQVLRYRGITNSVLLPNPVDDSVHYPPRTGLSKDHVNLAFVGRIAPEKGICEFIRLAAATDFYRIGRITFFGDGPDKRRLENRYADLIGEGRISFAGKLPRDLLFSTLRQYDAIALPSICNENAPVVIVEAALMGMPILVHDLGSMSTFGEEIGNKIKYASSRDSLVTALDRLVEHLNGPQPNYNIRLYSKRNYIARLRRIMGLRAEVPVVHDDISTMVS